MTEAPLEQLSGLRTLLERHSDKSDASSQIPSQRLDLGLERQKDREREILDDARRKKVPIQRQIEALQEELRQIDIEVQRDIDWTRRTK